MTTALMVMMRMRAVCWARHRDRAHRAMTTVALVIAATIGSVTSVTALNAATMLTSVTALNRATRVMVDCGV
jgi:hypothetical protein